MGSYRPNISSQQTRLGQIHCGHAHEYPEPPRDATALPAPGFAADPSTYPQPTGPPPIIRHDDSLNGDWKDFCPDPSNATKMQIPDGLHHIVKPGRTKTNWALDVQTLDSTGADKQLYLKMFAFESFRKPTRFCNMANRQRWLGLEPRHVSCRNECSRQQTRRVYVRMGPKFLDRHMFSDQSHNAFIG